VRPGTPAVVRLKGALAHVRISITRSATTSQRQLGAGPNPADGGTW
jgi:hypothetical protein